MSTAPYSARQGLAGRITRWSARLLARHPLAVIPLQPIVSVSFDDFPQSAATVAAAALERRGWRGSFYASAGLAGTVNHLGRMFDAGDLVRLEEAGHEIGCHTFGHGDAAAMRAADVETDVERNAQALAKMGLRTPPVTFAFPYGEASVGAKRRLMRRFKALRSVRPGVNRGRADRALLRVAAMEGGSEGIDRAIAAIQSLVARSEWVVLYGHDVRDNPSLWGCTPAELERVLDAVSASGALVLPVRDAIEAVSRPR